MTHHTKSWLVNLASSLFIFLFVYTAISKFLEFDKFQFTLSQSPLINTKAPLFAWGLPLLELLTATLLSVRNWRIHGLRLFFWLMVGFTLYILYMLLFVPKLPCSCGGMLQALTWKEHFIVNLLFVGLSYLSIRLEKQEGFQTPSTLAFAPSQT